MPLIWCARVSAIFCSKGIIILQHRSLKIVYSCLANDIWAVQKSWVKQDIYGQSVQVAILHLSVIQSVCNGMQWLKSDIPKLAGKVNVSKQNHVLQCNIMTLTMRYQKKGTKLYLSLTLVALRIHILYL